MSQHTIVVTGATGFIGTALLRRLTTDAQVVALTRDPDTARALLPASCTLAAWNAHEPVSPAILRGATAIVHLAGEPVAGGRWTDARKQTILDSRARSTRALVESIAALPRGERPRVLVSASAVGLYGDRGDALLDESSSAGLGFLAHVCRAWETAARGAEELGVRTVMLRLGVVLSPEGGAMARMLPPFRFGLGGRLGSGQQWMSWIHRDDAVRLIAFALADERVNGPLNAVAPEPLRNVDFTKALGRALGRPTLIPVPALGLRLMLGEMAGVMLDSQRVRPTKAHDLGFHFERATIAEALADISAPGLVSAPVPEPATTGSAA